MDGEVQLKRENKYHSQPAEPDPGVCIAKVRGE